MADDAIAQFTSFTGAGAGKASQYLRVADNNVEQAVSLFFESGGVDLSGQLPSETSQPAAGSSSDRPIDIDDDATPAGQAVEDDEAMARRLQNEMYGSSGGGGGARDAVDPETGVRAPMARTTETLADPIGGWQEDDEEMRAAVLEQMRARATRRGAGRPGIFNQREEQSIWQDRDSSEHQQSLSRATGGASETSTKASMLAEMFRPPTELQCSARTWEGVRAAGKEEQKWIMVNIQDPNIFDCQVLNRDIWKDKQIQDSIREHFVFKQYDKSNPQAAQYIQYYFQNVHSEDAYPHIAIVDPRTGEQVKTWSGSPAPKAMEFLMQIHEFLDRYSLQSNARNPVAQRKAERKKEKDPDRMTEEEQLAMAIQNSVGTGGDRKGSGPKEDDPDSLTRPQDDDTDMQDTNGHTTEAVAAETPFSKISETSPHEEPDAKAPDQTRIQFRHPTGRVIRRFLLADKVERIYEWLKADPLPEMTGKEFQLIAMGKDLLGAVEEGQTVADAGLRNGTVMVEFST